MADREPGEDRGQDRSIGAEQREHCAAEDRELGDQAERVVEQPGRSPATPGYSCSSSTAASTVPVTAAP